MSDPVKGAGQQALSAWVNKARSAVVAAYPTVFFGKDDPITNELERAFEFCISEYFCVPDSFMDWQGVMEAWRQYYRSCEPF